MLNLTQSATLIATAYDVDEVVVQTARKRLISAGALPAARGRDIPAAYPHRAAMLLLGLGVQDAGRINELADLRRFTVLPGDMPDAATLGDTLTFSIKGLLEQPSIGLDLRITLTLDNAPWAIIQNGSTGQTVMQFGEPSTKSGFVQTTTSISMMPLSLYAEAARDVTPTYPVSRQ